MFNLPPGKSLTSLNCSSIPSTIMRPQVSFWINGDRSFVCESLQVVFVASTG